MRWMRAIVVTLLAVGAMSGAGAWALPGAPVVPGCATVTGPPPPSFGRDDFGITKSSRPNGTSVAVTAHVPGLVVVQVDDRGAPIAVATNTGLAPVGDEQFAVWVDGGARDFASGCIRDAVLDAVGLVPGAWAPGEWHEI
jgi:hypothetical protein